MRYPRINVAQIPYHVFARGNNKQVLFRTDEDRDTYLRMIEKAHRKFGFIIFAYVLMDNHFHFLMQMLEQSTLSDLMHWIQLGYARYFNKKYSHVGHVFEARYHAPLVEKDSYFLTVDRYIHLNAVRAGMVKKPEDYFWSSYRSRIFNDRDIQLDHDTVLTYFGGDRAAQIKAYREFTDSAAAMPEEWSHEILQKTLVFGSSEFARRFYSRKD